VPGSRVLGHPKLVIAMPRLDQIDAQTLERYRDYLKLLARSQMDTWLVQQLDASDVVQQSMLDAVARRNQFRGTSEGELLAWLRAILSNNLVDVIRHYGRAKRDVARNLSLEDEISQSFRRIDALATDSQSSPSQRAAANEQLLRLPAVLDALPTAQREAIVLHYLQGLKLSETARALGRSEAAVGGLLHRGLKRLNELLEE
jgi:RNA polymerase sigma-70 factor (ECF subfamily)